MLPELSNLLKNITLYLETIVLGLITIYIFLLEILYFYYIFRTESEYEDQAEKILDICNIKTGYFVIGAD